MVLQFIWRKDFLLLRNCLYKTLWIHTYVSSGFTSLSVLLPFPTLIIFFVFSTVFHVILSNIDQVLLINSYANVFVFENFNIDHKDWLSYSGETDSDSWLWLSMSCSFGLISFFWC